MDLILRSPDIADEKRTLPGVRRGSIAREADISTDAQDEQTPHRTAESPDVTALAAREQNLTERLRQVDEAREHAYEKGHKEGYEKGFSIGDAEGRDAYTSGLLQLEQLTQNLNHTVQTGLEESEDMMVSIVFESVCKIVGDALASKEGVGAVVREALMRIRGKSALIIRVNPLDLELIEESAAFGVASEADWRADDGIPMGGCVVESEYGTLDARIDTQLNQLKRTLLAARHKPADDVRGA